MSRDVQFFNLDMIISVGYRVHSHRGVQFRMWATSKVFYRKILEIYATSIDYDPRVETTQRFFQTVQNKMHFSAHGHTAAELIYERADAEKDFMGLTSWTGLLPKRTDAEIAKI